MEAPGGRPSALQGRWRPGASHWTLWQQLDCRRGPDHRPDPSVGSASFTPRFRIRRHGQDLAHQHRAMTFAKEDNVLVRCRPSDEGTGADKARRGPWRCCPAVVLRGTTGLERGVCGLGDRPSRPARRVSVHRMIATGPRGGDEDHRIPGLCEFSAARETLSRRQDDHRPKKRRSVCRSADMTILPSPRDRRRQ